MGCAGLFFFLGMGLLLVAAVPNPVTLGVAAVAAVFPVPLFAFVILQLDRYEREPWQVLLAAFLWGAVVATFIAAISNDLIGALVSAIVGEALGGLLTTSVVAPIVEETAKGSALLLLYWIVRHEFDNVLDGIVYGSLVGIGFAMTENVLYFGRMLQENGLVGLGVLFYLRVILGGFGHALYTGTVGAGLGYAREVRRRWIIPIIIPLAYLLGIVQHAAWNFLGATVVPAILPDNVNPLVMLFVVMPVTTVVLTAPGVIALLIIATLAWRREAAVIRTHLQDEVPQGVLSLDEYERLPSQRARFAAEMRALRSHGLRSFFAQRDLHQAATELAFLKWHVSRGDTPRRAQRRRPEDRYRQLIAVHRTHLR
ncbi:MAG: PrsW family intramembrane metalloprotease [Chloroflexi bacterium]|nr:PrsW family intramembrane metalloprotease [Chloroflexota bacterium]